MSFDSITRVLAEVTAIFFSDKSSDCWRYVSRVCVRHRQKCFCCTGLAVLLLATVINVYFGIVKGFSIGKSQLYSY